MGGGGDPKVCVPKRAPPDFPDGKFVVFSRDGPFGLKAGAGGGGGHHCQKKSSNSGLTTGPKRACTARGGHLTIGHRMPPLSAIERPRAAQSVPPPPRSGCRQVSTHRKYRPAHSLSLYAPPPPPRTLACQSDSGNDHRRSMATIHSSGDHSCGCPRAPAGGAHQ